MSESFHVPSILPVPAPRYNLLHSAYDWEVPTYPNGEFDQSCHCDAPVVTPLHFSVFKYLEGYLTCVDVGLFCTMWTDGNESPMQDRLGERCEKAVSGCAKRRNHWGR